MNVYKNFHLIRSKMFFFLLKYCFIFSIKFFLEGGGVSMGNALKKHD